MCILEDGILEYKLAKTVKDRVFTFNRLIALIRVSPPSNTRNDAVLLVVRFRRLEVRNHLARHNKRLGGLVSNW